MRRVAGFIGILALLSGCQTDLVSPSQNVFRNQVSTLSTAVAAISPVVTSGFNHACALKSDGSVVCWGTDDYAAGLTQVPSNLPVLTDLSAGGTANCGVTQSRSLICWPGPSTPYWGPDVTPVITNARKVEVGFNNACVIRDDQTLLCWGNLRTAPSNLGAVLQVSVGNNHTCAVKPDQTVRCWSGDGIEETVPAEHATGALQVAAGDAYACVIKTAGTVACWGTSEGGVLNVPTDLGSARQISPGVNYACIVNVENVVKCWGGYGLRTANPPFIPTNVMQVSGGGNQTCALQLDGAVICWGNSNAGATAPSGLNLFVTPTPQEQIAELRVVIASLELPRGTATSLNAKLASALDALSAGNTGQACASLQDLMNETMAQSGKKIFAATATMILATVADIRANIGC